MILDQLVIVEIIIVREFLHPILNVNNNRTIFIRNGELKSFAGSHLKHHRPSLYSNHFRSVP